MSRMRPDIEYVKGYSVALLCLGGSLLLGALQFSFTFRSTEDDPVFALVSSILCLVGITCLVVSLLRWMRVAAALPATAAVSFCLLVAPLGDHPFSILAQKGQAEGARSPRPSPSCLVQLYGGAVHLGPVDAGHVSGASLHAKPAWAGRPLAGNVQMGRVDPGIGNPRHRSLAFHQISLGALGHFCPQRTSSLVVPSRYGVGSYVVLRRPKA